jgi:hypothetical protein
MAHSSASSSSSDAPGAAGHDLNPFHNAAPALPIAASSIPLLNIKHHVPKILDLHDSNYASWSSLFELTLLTQNVHLAPSTQQAEQAGFTRAENHKTCQSIFPEN